MKKKSEVVKTLKDIQELKKLVKEQGKLEGAKMQEIEFLGEDKIGQKLTLSEEEEKKKIKELKEEISALTGIIVDDEISSGQMGFIYSYVEGKSVTEISEKLKVSRQTIYTWLERDKIKNAIISLRKELFEASFIRLKTLNEKAVDILSAGLTNYDPSKRYEIAKFIVNANLRMLEVEKKKVELTEEKKSYNKETGEEQKKTVSISAEKSRKGT